MWERSSARVEGVVARIFKQIFNRRHIEVSKANQSSREIRRVVVSPEDTAKSWVEQRFQLLSEGSTTTIIFQTLTKRDCKGTQTNMPKNAGSINT